MRWIALDIGARRVGIAVGGSDSGVATPLPAIRFAGAEALAAEATALVERWQAGGVVVGMPSTRAGSSRGERRVAAVVEELRRQLGGQVVLADERGTTKAAEAILRAASVPRRKWRELVDSVAAKVLLETWLASRSDQRGSVDPTPREW